ncbi:MAG: type II secretion system secretin GspD [Myxococcales bacterium]|nr:type II secretion system secretin GspD [Myxococcales bacterium]
MVVLCALAWAPGVHRDARAQVDNGGERLLFDDETGKVRIDFDNVSITVIIDAISRLTGKNFIYDDRVRGKVTIISPSAVTLAEAWAVFESVLKIKGFTAIPGPAGVFKIVPVRDAKESNIETIIDGGESANRDQYVTRMIPLYFIDATAITNTLKPLISKDAAVVVFGPTNTIILTDTKANIRRILGILEALDVETHKQELAVIRVLYADADTLGRQITDIYGGQTTGGSSTASSARSERSSRRKSSSKTSGTVGLQTAQRGEIRIITESRTNSLLVLASRSQIGEIRDLIHKLDVPVVGGGKIHVYYLKHADAQEMAKTLNDLVSGSGGGRSGGGRTGKAGAAPQALRSVVTPLAEGQIRLSADPATNSLVIQASKEAYETLIQVIEKLDIPRPQVLVEALIMEVDITDDFELGFNFGYRILNSDIDVEFSGQDAISTLANPLALLLKSTITTNEDGTESKGKSFRASMQAAAKANRIKILSSPHILTSDNEEAEIIIGDNIPIITSRVSSAAGSNISGLSSSVNIERRDIGVTLRVTPQISDGNTLRLQIFQEITEVNDALSATVAGNTEDGTTDVGVALSNRRVQNTVVIADGDTVVIGGLIGEVSGSQVNKVPFLGDIPVLGWLFKSTTEKVRRTNLIIMLTVHIIRNPADLESESIYRRGDFTHAINVTEEIERMAQDVIEGSDHIVPRSQVEEHLLDHTLRYPFERLEEIEQEQRQARAAELQRRADELRGPRYMIHAVVSQHDRAAPKLTEILDLGYEAKLVSSSGVDGVVLELQVGPFGTLHEAESALTILHRSMHLDPYMVVAEPERIESYDSLAPDSEGAP